MISRGIVIEKKILIQSHEFKLLTVMVKTNTHD